MLCLCNPFFLFFLFFFSIQSQSSEQSYTHKGKLGTWKSVYKSSSFLRDSSCVFFFFFLLLPLVFVCFFKAPLQAAKYRVYIKRTGRALYAINSTWWMLLTIWLDFNGFYLDCVGCTYTVFACVLATAEDRRQNLCRRGSKMVAVKTVRVIVIFFFFSINRNLGSDVPQQFRHKATLWGGGM